MKSTVLLMSLVMTCATQAQSVADKVIAETRDALLKHRSVAYRADLHMKFDNMTDTFSFVENVKLLRLKDDTLFGGKILFSRGDSAFTSYTGQEILQCDTKTDSCQRFSVAKRETWAIEQDLRTMIIWRDFFHPADLDNMLKADRQKEALPDTVVSGELCWHVRSKRPDHDGIKDAVTHLYISQHDHAVDLEIIRVVVQGDVQYSWRQMLEHSFDTVQDQEFDMGTLLPKAIVTDFKMPGSVPMLSIGDPAPPLIGDLYGSTSELDTLRTTGHVTFVDFWYMSCPPCRTSTPVVDSLYAIYKNKGVQFVGVNAQDKMQDNLGKLPDFLSKRPIHYSLLIADEDLETSYKVKGHPAFYIIDQEGRIAEAHEGYGRGLEKEWAAKLNELLGAK